MVDGHTDLNKQLPQIVEVIEEPRRFIVHSLLVAVSQVLRHHSYQTLTDDDEHISLHLLTLFNLILKVFDLSLELLPTLAAHGYLIQV